VNRDLKRRRDSAEVEFTTLKEPDRLDGVERFDARAFAESVNLCNHGLPRRVAMEHVEKSGQRIIATGFSMCHAHATLPFAVYTFASLSRQREELRLRPNQRFRMLSMQSRWLHRPDAQQPGSGHHLGSEHLRA